MNVASGGRVIALFLSCLLTTISAHASTWLNVPASAAKTYDTNDPSNCIWDLTSVSARTPFPEYCALLFPIVLPAGTTIRQIWVVHGTVQPGLGIPLVAAHLRVHGNTTYPDQTDMFDLVDSTSYAPYVKVSTPLLPLFGLGFTMAGNKTYQVEVDLENGDYTTGIQVIYD